MYNEEKKAISYIFMYRTHTQYTNTHHFINDMMSSYKFF